MRDKAGAFGTLLKIIARLLPGDRLKTATYLNPYSPDDGGI